MRQEVILGMPRRAVAGISPQTGREITSEEENEPVRGQTLGRKDVSLQS